MHRSWQIVILRQAKKYLKKLSYAKRERILNVLGAMQTNPNKVPVKPLKGRPEKSLRVGDLRILLMFDTANRKVVVTRIGPRGSIYKQQK